VRERRAEKTPGIAGGVANGPRAREHDVKPDNRRGYRTSEVDSVTSPRSTHDIRGGSSNFFLPRRPPDSPHPRSHPWQATRARAGNAAFASAGIVRDGKIYPPPNAGNDDSPATASSGEPPFDRPHCNIGPEDACRETTLCSPSEDISTDVERVPGVACRTPPNRMRLDPREVLLPAGQVSEANDYLPPRRFFLANAPYKTIASFKFYPNHQAPPPPATAVLPENGPLSPRSIIRAFGSAKPPEWYRPKPRATERGRQVVAVDSLQYGAVQEQVLAVRYSLPRDRSGYLPRHRLETAKLVLDSR
jgi:hypothetical protein